MGNRRERGQTRAARLAARRSRRRWGRRTVVALVVVSVAAGAAVAWAAVSQVDHLYACVQADGTVSGVGAYTPNACVAGGGQVVSWAVSGVTTPTTAPTTSSTSPSAGEQRFASYITGYGYPDNNPPNSATICCPSVHQSAGGTGTVADPITVAVSNGPQFPTGTRFYVPNVRAYFVAEDAIGDTASASLPHLDLWAGGLDGSSAASVIGCENAITGNWTVARNPATSYAVVAGPLTQHGVCRTQYGNSFVAAGTTTTTTGATTTTRPASTTTTRPTTTTQPSGGTIVPAGANCPSDPSSGASHYEGKTLTVDQAVQALYGGGFRTMADLRMFVGIGRAESSLCVRTWHYHPTQSCPGFPQPCADRGWLQINDSFWPAYPDSQVLDPIGAAQAAHSIVYQHGGSYSTWDTAGTAAGLQATVAQVCAVVPSTVGC